MRTSVLIAASLAALCTAHPAAAKAWYVDASVPQSGDGKSWETAFKSIFRGLDSSHTGDMIVVAPGVYTENVDFNGRNVTLRCTDPTDPAVVASTVIDGGAKGPAVTFWGNEGESCLLEGFTITNGHASRGGGDQRQRGGGNRKKQPRDPQFRVLGRGPLPMQRTH